MSPNKRLRKLRVLAAMAVLQGERVQVVDRARRRLGESLAATLAPISARWPPSPMPAGRACRGR